MAKIGKIGWAKYFVMLFILWIALAVFYTILEMIPVIGWFLMFILMPAVAVFSSRYICLIYDSA
jgi:predicted PurR-regulated permease PerM